MVLYHYAALQVNVDDHDIVIDVPAAHLTDHPSHASQIIKYPI